MMSEFLVIGCIFADWIDKGEPGNYILHDLRTTPLQIVTKGPLGSCERVQIGLRFNDNNNIGKGGVKIELCDPPSYWITECSDDWVPFTPSSKQQFNTWTISRVDNKVLLWCDEEVIVEYNLEDSTQDNCGVWQKASNGFIFKPASNKGAGDTGSLKYRPRPGVNPGEFHSLNNFYE